jgi:hypothetical protein
MLGGVNPLLGGSLLDPDTYAADGSAVINPTAALPAGPISAIPPGTGAMALSQRPGMFAGRASPDVPIGQQISTIPTRMGSAALANLPQGMFANPGPMAKKPSFFGQGGTGRNMLGAVGDALLQRSGAQPIYSPMMQRRQALQVQGARQQAQFAHDNNLRLWQRDNQIDDRNFKVNQPQYFTAGNDRVAFDPATGQSNVLYHGSQPFEDYAAALGLKPGTPEYTKALQDYVLRGNGPTAYDYDVDLEGARQQNRLQLRSTPTYAQTHPRPASGGRGGGIHPPTLAGTIAPILAKVAHSEPLTPGEQTALDTYYRRGGKGGGGHGRGGITRVATNPQTGEKRGWNGTAWVPVP